MIALPDLFTLSPKRRALCSRENAQRVAARMVEGGLTCASVVRTGNPLQPLRVVAESLDSPDVVLEMRMA
nr:hypothetical protein [uncultured Sphingomonas sp.]